MLELLIPQTLMFISPTAAFIIAVLALVLFGPKKLPQFGRSIGVTLKEFKDGMSGVVSSDDYEDKKIEHKENDDNKNNN